MEKGQKQVPLPETKPKPKGRQVIIKTEKQIEGIRKSSQLTKFLLDMVEERIGEGVTSNEIDGWVYRETLANGAIPAPLNYGHGQGRRRMPFPKSVCSSPNNVICHGIPNNQALQSGDIVNIDVTCDLDGYFGDASRMFIIGDVPDRTRELVEVTRECLELGIEQVCPSNTLVTLATLFSSMRKNMAFRWSEILQDMELE